MCMPLGGMLALAVLAAPAPADASAIRLAIGAVQGDKGSVVSRHLQSALCATFECVPRSQVVTRGKVDFAKMRARGVSGFVFGAVTAKPGTTKLWLALLETSERPSKTWNLPVQGDGRVASTAMGAVVDDVWSEIGGADSRSAQPRTTAVPTPSPRSAPLSFARIAMGAIQGDPKSLLSGQLRSEICSRLACAKRSQVTTGGHVDLSKMQGRAVSGFLFGSVVKKGRTATLWLALITNSETPASTWTLALTSTGSLPRATLKATAAEVADLLAVRATTSEGALPLAPAAAEAIAQPAAAATPPVATPSPEPAPVVGSAAAATAAAAASAGSTAGAPASGAAAATADVEAAAAPPPAPAVAPAGQPAERSPAAEAAPAPPPPAQAQRKDGPRTEGLIPGILIGPKATATLLFPPSVMVGGELKVVGYVGASFEYGVYPNNTTFNGYSLGVQSWSAGLRAFPFRGSFFVGAVLGSYSLTGTQSVGGQTATLVVKSMYLGPQIGWVWDFDFGLFFGLNLGYGFSLNYTSSLSGPLSDTLQTAKDNADRYLKTGVPILTLLEMGWLF
ncbi:MAG TPA: hypothetical protein VMT17_11690 [Anaeromyxobacteraceae bacterium]|nr:hypothetical protein [Anaeromyxobacteraceae bacterium]